MFKFIAVLFLSVQVAVVFGIMTKDDLPLGIQNCLDNLFIPAMRHQVSAGLCTFPNSNNVECIIRGGADFKTNNDNEEKCLSDVNDLPPTQHAFTKAYLTNEHIKILKYDFSSELPENLRHCVDSMKTKMKRYFQRTKDCEVFRTTDDSEYENDYSSNNQDPYKECLGKIDRIYEDPQLLQCYEMTKTLTDHQKLFVKPYFHKIIFDF